jgi:serine/threonine protein kinase
MGDPLAGFTGLPRIVGRYALYGEIAAGGMATVMLGRLLGPVGFARTVAIKKLHAQYAKDPEFVAMFVDEARLAARIRHPNVVPTLDVVAEGGQLLLVMEYVHGESLSRLLRSASSRSRPVPPPIASAIVTGVLHGLHAAHEATSERGEPLGIVHRDVSPHNVIVCVDGLSRVLDFGIAKATGRLHTTQDGSLKGKLAYMSPEQVLSEPLTRRTDVYAAAVVLWETLTATRLFTSESQGGIVDKVLRAEVSPPSAIVPDLSRNVDEVVLRGLARDPEQRYATAQEMALALEECIHPATAARVGAWVTENARDALASRAAVVAEIESDSAVSKRGLKLAVEAIGPLRDTIRETSRAPDTLLSATPTLTDSVGGVRVDELLAQNTSVPVSVGSGRSRAGGWRRWGLFALLSAAVIAVALFVEARRARPATASAPAASTGAAVIASEPTPLPVVPVASTSAPANPSSPLPVSSAGRPPAARPAPRHAATTSSGAPPAAPSPDCTVPYTLDENGDKKWKLECIAH